MQEVIYNGGTDSFYPCDRPTDLKIKQTYKIRKTLHPNNYCTQFMLLGINGTFDSTWFNPIGNYIPEPQLVKKLLFAETRPQIGESITGYRVNTGLLSICHTQAVESISKMSEKIFSCQTSEAIYIVEIL